MTVLYIKESLGLKYFGKTTQDPIEYVGSGTRWLNHVRKHGKSTVKTLWYEDFQDEKLLNEFAEFFSDFFNVVGDSSWANLKPEDGLLGGSAKGRKLSEQTKARMRAKVISAESRERMSKAFKGVPKSPMHVANAAAAKKGVKRTPEQREKMKAAQARRLDRQGPK